MLQTFEIEIDTSGRIHPLESLTFIPSGRALLTLLERPVIASSPAVGRAGDSLTLLASSRFANRPVADAEEVNKRVAALRNGWEQRP